MIPVRDFGIGTGFLNSGISGNSLEFRAIPRNSVSIRFPGFLTGMGLCSDGITFKHITMHEGEGRRVIPVRNSGIGTHSWNW